MSTSEPSVRPGAGAFPGLVALVTAGIGASGLAGWIFDVEALKGIAPGLSTMKANTALGLMLGGGALALLTVSTAGARAGARVCATVVALIGAATLAEYLLGHDLGIDQLLFRGPAGLSAGEYPGRMGAGTASALLLLGTGLVALAGRDGARDLADALALIGLAIPFAALIGYVFSVSRLTGITSSTQMALHTAAGCALLSTGILAARPPGPVHRVMTSRGPGGLLIRRLLPLVLLLLAATAWLALAAIRQGFFDADLAMALTVLLGSIGIASCAVFTARLLDRLDATRNRDQAQLAEQAGLLDLAHVLVRDADGRIRLWNAGAEALYGWTREEALGQASHELLRSEFSHPLPEIEARLAQDGHWQGEVTHRRRDGRTVSVASHWVRHYDARGAPLVVEVNNDITDLKQAEASLREAQLRLRRILASSPAVIYLATVSADGPALQWVSENVAAFMGYPVEAVLRRGWWLDAVHPDDRAAVRAFLARRPEEDHGSLEYRLRYADGVYHWVRDDSRATWPGQDHPVELVGAWLDVTERRSLEAQFHQAQKMEAVGRLAGGVAHDFNNLITVILSYAELLQETMAGAPEHRENLGHIRRAAEAAARLTQQLLAFTRQQVLQLRSLDLNEVVRRSRPLLSRVFGESIEVVIHLSPDQGVIRGDPGQIEQVLFNLAVNARDAMGHGGKLTIETANVTVDAAPAGGRTIVPPGEYVTLAVSDTGAGMDEATRGRIFEPFFTTKGTAGSGLGLATVYGIVKQSEGFISVSSEADEGATFRIYFPRVSGSAEIGPTEENDQADLRGSGTVLLVEDVKEVRQVTRLVLERYGYRVVEAANGAAALELASAQPGRIDLLLTDVVMPEMSGFELAERIREQWPGIRLLFMSGYASHTSATQGAVETGVPYLQKPFRGAVLAQAVKQVLKAG